MKRLHNALHSRDRTTVNHMVQSIRTYQVPEQIQREISTHILTVIKCVCVLSPDGYFG